MLLIGLSGKAGCGKSTLAQHLCEFSFLVSPENLFVKAKRVSIADAIRKEVQEIFGIPESITRNSEMKSNSRVAIGYNMLSLREFMQWWGWMRRETDFDYWVNKFLEQNDVYNKNNNSILLVDDIRFKNEADLIKSAGGFLFRLEPYPGYKPEEYSPEHISENSLDDYKGFNRIYRPAFGKLPEVADDIVKYLASEDGGKQNG